MNINTKTLLKFFEKIGRSFSSRTLRLGSATRLFFLILIYSADSFKRIHLTIREVYFTGVMSLVIIIVSGTHVHTTIVNTKSGTGTFIKGEEDLPN